MEKFELSPNNYKLWDRVRKELSLLILLIAILLFFVGLNVIYFTAVIVMYTLLLTLKRNRILTCIQFNDENQTLDLEYFYLITIKSKESVPYHKLSCKLSMKRFGFGAATQTLELFKGKILCCEIQKEGKWKWSEEQIDNIHKRISDLNK